MLRTVFRLLLVLATALTLLTPDRAMAQCVANPVPNEPPICEALTPAPVETGTLTRGGGLVLPPGAAQAGGGPGLDLVGGRLGIPASFAYGLSDKLELGAGFTSYLTPAPWDTQFNRWLGQMFVSNLGLYGRWSITPEKLAISAKITFLGPITGQPFFSPMLIQAEAPFTTELSDSVRLYWVNNLTMLPLGTFQALLNTSGTFMFMLNDTFYAQALVGTAVGVASSGPVVPFVHQPIQVGTGGGMLTGDNQGIGLAINAGFAQPVTVSPGVTTSALTNLGVIATYVKAI